MSDWKIKSHVLVELQILRWRRCHDDGHVTTHLRLRREQTEQTVSHAALLDLMSTVGLRQTISMPALSFQVYHTRRSLEDLTFSCDCATIGKRSI